jgi:hypothetical protein
MLWQALRDGKYRFHPSHDASLDRSHRPVPYSRLFQLRREHDEDALVLAVQN